MQDAAEQLASIAEQADEADKSVPSTNNGMYCRFPVQFLECNHCSSLSTLFYLNFY